MRKKFQSRIRFTLDLGKKILKKIEKKNQNNKKHLSGIIFSQNVIGREREKKILVPISVHTWSEEENSERNSKKILKIKKPLSGIIFSQNEIRLAKKKRKKI